MKNITSCLLLTILSFLYFQGGSPEPLNPNEVRVGLYYNFDFVGHVEKILRLAPKYRKNWFLHIPDWMQPYGQRPVPEGLHFFIRTDTPEHYEASLRASNHVELSRYTSIPELAKVRLENHIYKTVGDFGFYNPEHNSSVERPWDPPTNRIYVCMPNGPTYSAPVVRETMGASSSSVSYKKRRS